MAALLKPVLTTVLWLRFPFCTSLTRVKHGLAGFPANLCADSTETFAMTDPVATIPGRDIGMLQPIWPLLSKPFMNASAICGIAGLELSVALLDAAQGQWSKGLHFVPIALAFSILAHWQRDRAFASVVTPPGDLHALIRFRKLRYMFSQSLGLVFASAMAPQCFAARFVGTDSDGVWRLIFFAAFVLSAVVYFFSRRDLRRLAEGVEVIVWRNGDQAPSPAADSASSARR